MRKTTRLNGRSEQISLANGVSSTYDCRNCCPDSTIVDNVTPFASEANIGNLIGFFREGHIENCYGQATPIAFSNGNWQSSNSSIAIIGSSGNAQAMSAGMAILSASWLNDEWFDLGGSRGCRLIRYPADDSGEMMVRPTVSIGNFKAVAKNFTTTVRVTVNNNSNNEDITLTLVPNSGGGVAQFTNTNSTTRIINGTTDVEIKGITESSTTDNMRLRASFNGSSYGNGEAFTVISVALSLRTGDFTQISSDNRLSPNYETRTNTNFLGKVLVNTNTPNEWGYAVEIVGVVKPSNFTDEILLERRVVEFKIYKENVQIQSGGPFPDTSAEIFYDNDPRPNGNVYDLDVPRISITGLAFFDVKRFRVNFVQYATFEGNIISDDFEWYSRISIINSGGSDGQVFSDISGDNKSSVGTTPLSWNLQ